MLLGYPEGSTLNEFYQNQLGEFLGLKLWEPQGNIPALAILVSAYCQRLPNLIVASFDPIAEICQHILKGGRSHPHGFAILLSMIRFIPMELLGPLLPAIFDLVIAPLNQEEQVTKYTAKFAVFMSDACFTIGPDVVFDQIPPDMLQLTIDAWGHGLLYVRGRPDLEAALAGALKAVCEGSLSGELWFQLFSYTVRMVELPPRDILDMEVQAMREEEQDAKEFDTAFSKLRYATLPGENLHPDLKDVHLPLFTAQTIAEFSHARPGVVPHAIAQLPQQLQSTFQRYQERDGLEFV
jgi:hypothetical protein